MAAYSALRGEMTNILLKPFNKFSTRIRTTNLTHA